MSTPDTRKVVIEGLIYRRFEGRKQTHKAEAGAPLTAEEVEQFRVSPAHLLEPEAA